MGFEKPVDDTVSNQELSLIDTVVGRLLRKRCRELKLTQEDLGHTIATAFQQFKKYEKGALNISLKY